ncbi:hypothetical protein NPIL_215291 [Nephila pilipes]|uniref:Uncharacterized protein n=1 Tax=Nephila pilipes TaxID=299642 RepID=A0A8X6TRU7_NEPPI|nr:hypothetical protein NPIL_215291 [Nephila pilipes]
MVALKSGVKGQSKGCSLSRFSVCFTLLVSWAKWLLANGEKCKVKRSNTKTLPGSYSVLRFWFTLYGGGVYVYCTASRSFLACMVPAAGGREPSIRKVYTCG